MNLEQALHRINELKDHNVFIAVDPAATGDGPVIAVKDCVDVAGLPTTAGGVILGSAAAQADSPVVARIRAAGCVIVGKTNMHEFAFGVTNVNPHYGTIPNPFDPARVVGGSSGGSAAAVAYGMCDWSVGSDTGGSIRIPAALCGVVGVKPTHASVPSIDGVIPLSRSLDVLGPLAPDVATATQALAIMRGEAIDPPTPAAVGDYRLAVPRGWAINLDAPTTATWDVVSEGLPEIDFPALRRLEDAFQAILFAEAGAYHREWIVERPGDYGPDVLGALQLASKIRAVDYLAALAARERLSASVESALDGWDAVLLPTTACVAPRREQEHVREPLLRMCRPFNLTGHPVVSIPAPVGAGLPVGIQVVGHLGQDVALLGVAAALEAAWAAHSGGTS
jgi:aspartyl-tRNA(Asn)/glutamyl-tRNA(Gln) amidotransferase subunit A